MGEAGGAAVLDQAVHLRHAGSRSDQHQRTVGQFRQMRVAERQLDPCQALARSIVRSARRHCLPWPGCAPQVASRMRRGGQGKRRAVAAVTLQQQVLPGVIAWRACRPARAGRPGRRRRRPLRRSSTGRSACAEAVHRRQHPVPMQHAVFQRLGEAGEEFAMIAYLAVLAYPPSTSSAAQIWQLPLRQLCGQS